MQFRVSAYLTRRKGEYRLSPVCGGIFDWSLYSRDASKVRQHALDRLRKELPTLPREVLPRVEAVQGRRLERVRLEFNLAVLEAGNESRATTGLFPLVIEQRLAQNDKLVTLAYHPYYPTEWFEVDEDKPLAEQAERLFAEVLEYDELARLKAEQQDKLVTLSFNAEPPSLLSLIRSDGDPQPKLSGLGTSGEISALLRVATNETAHAAEQRLDAGMPRPGLRERMASLLCGDSKRSVLVIGPPGSGKSTLIAQAVYDLLEADNYLSHRNLDRVHNVWRMQGRHIIAGMSYVGQWEARSVELLARARQKRMVLWVEDLHTWPRLGRTVQSERCLADFFRAPLARHSLLMIGEITAEQLAVLERDAPGFAASFARVYVEPSNTNETLGMMLHEARKLEADLDIAFDPQCYGKILDLSASLLSSSAFPGKALEPLKALGRKTAAATTEFHKTATTGDVVGLFSQQTGLPELLLSSDQPLERSELQKELLQQIMGQPLAVEAACDLILSIRAGLCARGRPYGVFLFSGPTGTGKTELAKCIAEYLYGDPARLLRFDMGELNTPLAPERLIGSAYEPDGHLTRSVRAQPFCVLLFDEIEKAHPSVLNLLLQLLDDGLLTDASGSVADFTHAVVVMTSNLGAGLRRVGGFAEDAGAVKADIARAIREFFPPELFNRIDRVVAFEPLSRGDAERIARKELGKLAARPGLAERNVFLRFSQAVVERVVHEAYKPEYGARALKRYVDREVGDLIAAQVTAEGSAELRLFYLHVSANGRLAIRAEALREAELVASPTELEELLSERGRALLERVPQALEFLRGVSEERLAEFGRRVSEELGRYRSGERDRSSRVFSLDVLRAHVSRLLQQLEEIVVGDEELQEQERAKKRVVEDDVEAEDYRAAGEAYHRQHAYEWVSSEWAESRYRREAPRSTSSSPRPLALLHDLVEARFLKRALSEAHDPEQHAVLLELVRLGELSERRRFSGGNPGLLEWLAPAYARARGELERAAVTFPDGRLETARTVEALDALLHERAQSVALLLLGPSVRSFFAGENGCHVRRTATFGPEIVRVRVLAAADPAEHLRNHDQKRKEFTQALESGAPLPNNPEGLLPIIRSLRLNPEPDKAVTASLEDYRLGYVSERRVRVLGDLLQVPWLLSAGAMQS